MYLLFLKVPDKGADSNQGMKVSINKSSQLYNTGISKSTMHGDVYSYIACATFFNFEMAVKYTFQEVHSFSTILKIPWPKKSALYSLLVVVEKQKLLKQNRHP